MKIKSVLAVLALLGSRASSVMVEESSEAWSVQATKSGKKIVSVRLSQTEYEHDRYQEFVKPLSS